MSRTSKKWFSHNSNIPQYVLAISTCYILSWCKQVQIHCIYPYPKSDVIQLNAPDYDLDIDGEPATTIDEQLLNAESAKEDTQQPPPNLETALPFHRLPIGLSISPQKFQQILTTQKMIVMNKQEQNTPAITAPHWKTSLN